MFMFNADTSPQTKFFMPEIHDLASSQKVEVISSQFGLFADIEPALARFAGQPNSGLILLADVFSSALRRAPFSDQIFFDAAQPQWKAIAADQFSTVSPTG